MTIIKHTDLADYVGKIVSLNLYLKATDSNIRDIRCRVFRQGDNLILSDINKVFGEYEYRKSGGFLHLMGEYSKIEIKSVG